MITRRWMSEVDDDNKSLSSEQTLDVEAAPHLLGSPLERMDPYRIFSLFDGGSNEEESRDGDGLVTSDKEDNTIPNDDEVWEEDTEVQSSRNKSWERVWAASERLTEHAASQDGPVSESLPQSVSNEAVDISILPSTASEMILVRLLNSDELRRDPWNITLRTDLAQYGGSETTYLLRQKVHHKWNEAPLDIMNDCFNFVRQLIEGLAFFHEHGMTHIPFSEDNILMDIGLAPPDQPLDRSAYPVKYYLASLDGVKLEEVDNDVMDGPRAMADDIHNLGYMIERLFADLPGDPLSELHAYMSAKTLSPEPLDFLSNPCRRGPTAQRQAYPKTAVSCLELLTCIEKGFHSRRSQIEYFEQDAMPFPKRM